MKFVTLSIISIALLVGPVLGDFRDILEICNQTPYTGLFRKYLIDNPDLLAIYQARRNSTIYVPSDRAMRKHFADHNLISRRATAAATVQAQYMIEQQANAIKEAQKQARSVRKTTDTKTSPDGSSSVVVTVNNGGAPPPIKRHFRTSQADTGVSIMSGAGESAKILFGDIQSIQGIIHVVDNFFSVPEPVTDTLKLTNNTKFLDSTNAANLGSTFDQTGQITLFVPIDSAFENQPPLDATSIKYHIINDVALYSTLLVDGAVFETVGCSRLYVDIIGGITHINCVPLVQSDILASGGAIHTVGEILKPLWSKPVCS